MSSSKDKLVYDICSVPEGINLDKVMSVWKKHDVVIYDSFKGNTPFLYNGEVTGKLLDIASEDQETINQINKLLKR
jgi:serine protease inhibitor